MRWSMRSPSIVCVRISAHSSSSSGPGLLMISLRDRDLADVVQQGAELEVAHAVVVEPHRRAHLERERDDAAGVLARVRVVGLDDVAQHDRRAAIRAVELLELLEPLAPLMGEEAEDRERAEHEGEPQRLRGGGQPAISPSGVSSTSTT